MRLVVLWSMHVARLGSASELNESGAHAIPNCKPITRRDMWARLHSTLNVDLLDLPAHA